ncbi:Leucine-rich repeat-containing protein 34, partial [Cichlidogyrus casuarinus]
MPSCRLVVLDLAFNRIQCKGAKTLAYALIHGCNHLKVLQVSYNELKDPGLCALADALSPGKNSMLRCLYAWGNEFGERASKEFGNLIHSGRLLRDFTDVEPYEVDCRIYVAER